MNLDYLVYQLENINKDTKELVKVKVALTNKQGAVINTLDINTVYFSKNNELYLEALI